MLETLTAGIRRRAIDLSSAGIRRTLLREKREQLATYERLTDRFSAVYDRLARSPADAFVTSAWTRVNRELSSVLLPHPPRDFMRDRQISGAMVLSSGGSLLRAQLEYLQRRLPSTVLSEVLREDPLGQPLLVNRRFQTSHLSIHHLFLLERFFEATGAGLDDLDAVVEWGGGYGDFAKILWRRRGPTTYLILDTPLIAALQWLYLSSVFGEENVNVIAAPNSSLRPRAFNVASVGMVDKLELKPDLFVSTWALSESSHVAQRFVSDNQWLGAQHLLLAFHLETSPITAEFPENRVLDFAVAAGARIERPAIQPHDGYAFR